MSFISSSVVVAHIIHTNYANNLCGIIRGGYNQDIYILFTLLISLSVSLELRFDIYKSSD